MAGRRMDTSVGVVWLKMAPGFYPHAGLGLIRSLGRLGVPVYAVHEEPRAPELRSRYLTDALIWDSSNADGEATLEALRGLATAIGGRPILVPSDDIGSIFLDDHAGALSDCFRFPAIPPGLIRMLCSKREAHRLARELDVPVPDTLFPRERDEIGGFAASASYPIVAKAVEPWALHGRPRAPSVFIAADAAELLAFCDSVHDPQGPNLILQEYIPGGAESVWMFNGYFDAESECLFGLTGTKLRQFPPYTGVTTLGICASNPTVEATTRRLMKRIGYRGILDIGYRHDRRDGRYKLLDVNPRIGGTFRLFADARGGDVARAMYLDLTGQDVPPAIPRPGRKWLVENFDAISSVRYAMDGNLGLVSWLRSFRGVDEGAWFARDDLRPFAAMVPRSIRLGVKAGIRRRRMRKRREGTTGGATDGATSVWGTATEGAGDPQRRIDAYFSSVSSYWRKVYEDPGLQATIYRDRLTAVCRLIQGLGLPRGSSVLEIGCGAGDLAMWLARQDFTVEAIDGSEAMAELAGRRVKDARLDNSINVSTGDVHALEFSDERFALVVAVGVLPWLHSPARALTEIARVCRSGGHVVLTADNRRRMNFLLDPDPRTNPLLSPAWGSVKRRLERAGLRQQRPPDHDHRFHDPAAVDGMLARAGLQVIRRGSVGFGPLSLLGRPLPTETASVKLHARVQAFSGRWPLRTAGAHYVALASKR